MSKSQSRPSRHGPFTTVSTDIGSADIQKSRTREKLIELLAQQFAYPVKWIDTQNEFLADADAAHRIIEIGPAKVLATMAEKTAAKKADISRIHDRRFLSYAGNLSEINYDYTSHSPSSGQEIAPAATVDQTNLPPKVLPEPVMAQPAPANITAPQAVQASAAPVADIPLVASDLVVALTAQKLKMTFDALKVQQSIRDLSGGKSTLQNELIGDLGAEFGAVPDGAEDMPLETLGATLAGSFTGKPGKQVSALVSKLISTKMPGGFNQAAMRARMESRWGLGPQRQMAVICFATTVEPPARLADEATAIQWLDTVITQYASYCGVTLSAEQQVENTSIRTHIDAASLEIANKEQRDFLEKQFHLLANHLHMSHNVGADDAAEMLLGLEVAEEKLRQWTAEFDEDFFTGIQPSFDANKARRYDSWWNWSRSDLIDLSYRLQSNSVTDQEVSDTLRRILNRWDSTCTALVSRSDFSIRLSNLGLDVKALLCANEPKFVYTAPLMGPNTTISAAGIITYSETPRQTPDGSTRYDDLVRRGRSVPGSFERVPFVHLQSKVDDGWRINRSMTSIFLDTMSSGMSLGYNFSGVTALVTGAGPDSIGSEVVRGLLQGGATVIVTTSRAPSASAAFYNAMYKECAGSGSKLEVFPFNQASKQDCTRLIEHIYSEKSDYDDIDFIVPFAAIPDQGTLDRLESKSELAHRAMLVNLLRLLGKVKSLKEGKTVAARPTNVLLPLSPNHGTFGGDGLYGESKIGLETLLNRGKSEGWGTLLTMTGVIIGWTRGTGLMSGNNIVAEAIEKSDVLTFSQREMAFNILSLMTPEVCEMCEEGPICADLNGGLQFLGNLKDKISSARGRVLEESRIGKALAAENAREKAVLHGPNEEPVPAKSKGPGRRRAMLNLDFPELQSYANAAKDLSNLQGMLDLDQVVVIVGYSELSPWGSARTRWEMESSGHFTTESLVEMAWMTGMVQHRDGDVQGETTYSGWIDSETKEAVHDADFRQRYEKEILAHSGLRFIESEGLGGYDPSKKEQLYEVVVKDDLPAFEASKASAEALLLRHGDRVTATPVPGSDDYRVQIKQGAHFYVPKAIEADRFVAGQLPRGWDPLRYGIPADIVSQVDPVVIYALCCVCEAVLKAGMKDPAELFKHIHVSELANCLGTGAGSLLAMRKVYRDRYMDRNVQNDILQESYLNAIGAWTNMLLLGAAGPIKTPTGTCATALESLDTGCDMIKSGKAKVAFVGGSDDFQEEMSYEFGNMKATCNTHDELAKGRLPSEMSRPTASSRSGFVESAGCGVQIVTSASLALHMGLPIYGIVAYSQMAGDKIGRSVPAPGKGILTAARETKGAATSPLLNLKYRRENLQRQVQSVLSWKNAVAAKLHDQAKMSDEERREEMEAINSAAIGSLKDAQRLWGNNFCRQVPGLNPLRASLAVWDLTIDDIAVASFHGTSTKANDINESSVINTQMQHLGRSPSKPLMVVCQKYLTGHTKGAAAALMLNGGLQMLQKGVIPGNRNADNVDKELRQYQHLVYPSSAIQTNGINGMMLTSFGFGQKGGLAVIIAPHHLFGAVDEQAYTAYVAKARKRQTDSNVLFAEGVMTNSLFKAKSTSAWENVGETRVFLDPEARIAMDEDSQQLAFTEADLRESTQTKARYQPPVVAEDASSTLRNAQDWLQSAAGDLRSPFGVGVDTEAIDGFPLENDVFVQRNFTVREQNICQSAPDPRASFAGRWSAKEAVFKSLRTPSQGSGAAMRDIEIVSAAQTCRPGTESSSGVKGAPEVVLTGKAKQAAEENEIGEIHVSISHDEHRVVAVALANRKEAR